MVLDLDGYQYGPEMRNRRRAWQIGGFFAAFIAILMFFSSTIYNYNLPRVTASKPLNGYLNKRETSSGYADWETIDSVYSAISGTIAEVFVKEYDWVEAGQVLFRMSYDRTEAERKLREIKNSREKLELDIRNINLRIEKAERSIADSKASQEEARKQYNKELSKAKTNDTTSNDIVLIDLDIKKAEQTLADTRILLEAGAATEREVANALDSLEVLHIKRETTINTQKEQKEKDLEKELETLDTLRRNISNYDKPIADGLSDIKSLEIDLESRQHDLIGYELQSEPYLELLAGYDDNVVILSKTSGLVLTVPVEQGRKIGENALMATIGAGHDYIIKCTISNDNNFVFPGDSCELSNTAHILYGDIISISPGDRGKALEVRVSSPEVTAGETFNLTFESRSEVRYTLVPNGALNQDSDGYYLNMIRKEKGLLGKEFMLSRLDVYIGDSDTQNTVITGGFRFFEPIVLTSDKPVQPGDTVKLTNEADFFAD